MNSFDYKEIGGYLELELANKGEFYPELIRLNTGRNCLEYILKVRGYKKIYIPYYTCEVVLEPVKKIGLEYEFYTLDNKLDIVFDKKLEINEAILINNYFGIENKQIRKYIKQFTNVIVDNSQAFFDRPINNVDTFYSARKFFGVADGAYLSIDKKLPEELEQEKSFKRMKHLLKRIDESAADGYKDFRKNDDSLINQPIKIMSKLTHRILCSIDYENVKMIRNRNFLFLHSYFKDLNLLDMDISYINAPMVYPLLCKKEGLRKQLINNKIYVATYWPNVKDWISHENSFEVYLHDNLLPLPIDQRYSEDDMRSILDKF